MDQQFSAIVKKLSNVLAACHCKFMSSASLNRHWSIVWSMTVCWIIDQPSFRRRINSSISHTEF